LFSVILVGVVSVWAAPVFAQDDAEAKEEFEDTIHVVQEKPVVRQGRLEVTPKFGASINDPVYQSFKAGANLSFNISERVYVSGLFEWYDFGDALGGTTQNFSRTVERTRTAPEAPVLNWVGGLEVGYMPLYGKFALFNSWILYYDLGVTLGPAVQQSTGIATAQESTGLGATGSITGRLFFNDWMALSLELRDVLFSGPLSTGSGGTVSKVSNVVTATAGISIMLPPKSP
jgi:outer membrane beta-barrel protein